MDDDQRKAMFAKKNGNGSKPASNTIDSNATKVSKQVPVTTKTFGLSKNVLSEIKSQVGNDVEVDEVGEPYSDSRAVNMVTMSDGSEWLVYDDYDEMKFDAEDEARQNIEDGLFNQDWLESYMTVSETDARLFGNDFGDMMVEDRDLDELKEMANQYDIDYDDPDDIEDDDKREEAEEKLEDKLINEVSYARSKEVEKTILRDGLKSFVCDDEGLCSEDEFQDQYGNYLNIDYEKASEDAVSEDGIGHFLSSYDGEVHETKGNEYLIRIN